MSKSICGTQMYLTTKTDPSGSDILRKIIQDLRIDTTGKEFLGAQGRG